ncbi:MAG TPA: LLM class F420-dependent oxidoreductase [Acidimicrobiales bacterium]|nr:LLM class F420-dependent oxidoreductase [Acidimicrobiales bacterium]
MAFLIDGTIGGELGSIPEAARALEAAGYDGGLTSETSRDPMLPLVLAAEHTERLQLGTGIVVAFARSPMTLAYTARDLQVYSRGRLMLGLGSQIKPHIEKRFSMPWSHPAARMREFVLAMRAVWDCWDQGAKLEFRGEFYRHTLMTPFFSPPPHSFGPPKVFIAAVGERLTETVGEVADGMLVHPFTTERYIREVTVPALDRGAAKVGKTHEDVQLSLPVFVVTGRDESEAAAAATAVRRQIAFYASTPAYRGVLELHGWGEVQSELNALSKQGEWEKMGDVVDEEILGTFAVVAEPDAVPGAIEQRFAGLIDRVSFYVPYALDGSITSRFVSSLRGAG